MGSRACGLRSRISGAFGVSGASGILVPQAGIDLVFPYVTRQILNHWTTREVLTNSTFFKIPHISEMVEYLSALLH